MTRKGKRTFRKESECPLFCVYCLSFSRRKADAERLTRSLKHTMSTYCMINRTETGLSAALQELEGLKSESAALSMYNAKDGEIAALARIQSQLLLSTEMVKAMRKRTESLGSHYRAD